MRVSVCILLFTFNVFLNSVQSTGRIFVDRHDRQYTEDARTKIVYGTGGKPANQGLILFDLEGNVHCINRRGKAAPYESTGLILWDDYDNHYMVNCQDHKVYDSEHNLANIGLTLYDRQGNFLLVDYNREICFLKAGHRTHPSSSSEPIDVNEIQMHRQTCPRTSAEPVNVNEIEFHRQTRPRTSAEPVNVNEIEMHRQTRPRTSAQPVNVEEIELHRQTRPRTSAERVNVEEIERRRQIRPGSSSEPINVEEIERRGQTRPGSSLEPINVDEIERRHQTRLGSSSGPINVDEIELRHQMHPRTSAEPINGDVIARDSKPLGRFNNGMIYPPNRGAAFKYVKVPGDTVKIQNTSYSTYAGGRWWFCNLGGTGASSCSG